MVSIFRIKVNPEYEAIWGELPRAQFKALKDSILNDELLERIVVNPELTILDGHNRYRALEELGIDVTEEHYRIKDLGSREEEILYILRTGINRRHATPYHRVENTLPLLDIMKARAAAARTLNLPIKQTGKFARVGRVRDQIAEIVGLSGRTVEKALYIVKFGDEGLKERLRRNTKPSIDNAYRQVREVVEPKSTPQLPVGIFDVVYADPPWDYYHKLRGAPDDHYPTMTTEEICALEVPAADDSVLLLWATNPKLEDAFRVIKAWGFDYKTNLAWVKDIWGTGYYFRGQHELLLLATRGDIGPPPMAARRSSVLHAPRGKHSEKPREIYDLIEGMYPGHTYLELFAREKREGWTSWGLGVT